MRRTFYGALFQFPNGSIKSNFTTIAPFAFAVFQFPNGSIKRLNEEYYNAGSQSFNSLMVRLKAVQESRRAFAPLLGFNSLMVRLKALVFHEEDNWEPEFQFPNGSIKSVIPVLKVF